MRHILWIAALAYLTGSGLVLPVGAGCPDVDRELERTRNALMEHQEKLEQCSVPHAQGLVEQAIRALREAAKQSRGGRCRRAGLQVEAAKGLLERANRLCSDTDHQQDQVFDFLSETDRLMQRAFDRSDRVPDECRRLYRVAREQQDKAWRQFRGKKPRFALNLSGAARRSVDTAMRCLGKDGGAGVSPSEVERLLERTDHLLERVHGIVNAPGKKQGSLKQAEEFQKRAHRSFGDGKIRQAVQFSRQSRRLAMRVLSVFEGNLGGPEAESMVQAAMEFVEDLTRFHSQHPDRKAKNLLKRAKNQLREGKDLLGQNDLPAAMASIRMGLSLALKAAELQDPRGQR